MWASCNLGASSPQESGGYYAWGEVEEKDKYSEENYVHGPRLEAYPRLEEYNIHGTNFDVVTKILGENYRMPTRKDFAELIRECKWENYELFGVVGKLVTGKNGNSIFIPGVGHKEGLANSGVDYYWTSSANNNGFPIVLCYVSLRNEPNLEKCLPYIGLPIRPVKSRR